MDTTDGDAFYESWERLRDLLAREERGEARFRDATDAIEEPHGEEVVDGDLVVEEDGFRVCDGTLRVRGDVTLEDGGILYVRGNLEIEGTLVTHGHYTLTLVGGKLTVEAAWVAGEFAVLGGIEALRLFWTRRNDYSGYAPRLKTPLYIAEDRVDSIDEFEVEERIQGHIGEIADDLSYEFGSKIWSNREEFELDDRRLESIIRIP